MGCATRSPQPSEPGPQRCRLLHRPVAFQVGDEEEILPTKLQNEMLTSLDRHNNNNNEQSKDGSLDTLKHGRARDDVPEGTWPGVSLPRFATKRSPRREIPWPFPRPAKHGSRN